MSNAALPPNPLLENVIFQQTNQNMRNRPVASFSYPMRPFAPFTTDQGYGLNELRPLDNVPTLHPIKGQSISSTITTYNAPNIDPRTLHNAAGIIPYGYGRGQVSANTDLVENRPQPIMMRNNNDMFTQLKLDKKVVPIRQYEV